MPRDLRETEGIRVRFGVFLFIPAFQGALPNVARARQILANLVTDATEFKKDCVAARVNLETLAKKLFGFFRFIHAGPQPMGAYGVGFDSIRIESGRDAQPGQYLA